MNSAFANVKTITKREISAYFASPVAYVFIVIFLLLAGFFTFMAGGLFSAEPGKPGIVLSLAPLALSVPRAGSGNEAMV